LESTLCSLFHSLSSLLFNSGYEANVSIFSTIPQPNDIILFDSLIHASVHDGIRSSRTDPRLRLSFKHNDLEDFEELLNALTDAKHERTQSPSSRNATSKMPFGDLSSEERDQISKDLKDGRRNIFLALETVYSMDGDFCLLKGFLDIFEKYFPRRGSRFVVIDEAHSTGVYGRDESQTDSTQSREGDENEFLSGVVKEKVQSLDLESPRGGGEGFTFQQDELDRVDIRLMTFGKAVGAGGGECKASKERKARSRGETGGIHSRISQSSRCVFPFPPISFA